MSIFLHRHVDHFTKSGKYLFCHVCLNYKLQLIVVKNRRNKICAGCRYLLMNALSLSLLHIFLQKVTYKHTNQAFDDKYYTSVQEVFYAIFNKFYAFLLVFELFWCKNGAWVVINTTNISILIHLYYIVETNTTYHLMIKVLKMIHFKYFVKRVNLINFVIKLLKYKKQLRRKRPQKLIWYIIFYEGRRNPEKVVTGML